MCDTFFVPSKINIYHSNLLCKNSDREPNEAQAIEHYPRKKTKEKFLKTTYIEIEQTKETNEIIISRPFHIWGAEMGVNEFGVAIGNEAVFTKIPFKKDNSGLTGMDLIRLALQRTQTAKEALELIVELIQKYGQDACGGYENKNFYYHNSFLILDRKEAYNLETAGKFWVYKKISNFYSISNGLTITTDYDQIHPEAIDFAIKKKWYNPKKEKFNFQKVFSDKFYTYFSKCEVRRRISGKIQEKSKIELKDCIEILQSHGNNPETKLDSMESICLHSGGITTPSETTGSMISILRESLITVWLTGTSHPCLSLYKPFYFGTNILESLSKPTAKYDSSLWWTAELIHRKLLEKYSELKKEFQKEIKELQNELIELDLYISKKRSVKKNELREISEYALEQEKKLLYKWNFELNKKKFYFNFKRPIYFFYRKKLNYKANLKI